MPDSVKRTFWMAASVVRHRPPAPLDLATAERLREERLAEHMARRRAEEEAERAQDEATINYLRDRLRFLRGPE